jgi:glycosyltransferase involved in cell wall biosynthesis
MRRVAEEGRPLRVAMVVYADYHVDSRVQRQARALADRGDAVDIVCLSPAEEQRVGAGTIRLHQIDIPKARGGARAYVSAYAGFVLRAGTKLSALDREHRFHVVETHNMPDAVVFSALAARRRGARVILNIHDTFPELFATKFGCGMTHPAVQVVKLQERMSGAFADAHITVTEAARTRLMGRGVGAGGMEVIMNTPDERLFGPPRPPVAAPAAGRVRAIYHGGLDERFGPELLIAAVARVPELTLRICGTGSRQAELTALADTLAPGRVDIAPAPIPLEGIPAELRAANLGVVPTLRDPFTELLLPVKLMEYVHMGLPAIAPALPVVEQHFGDGEVVLFEPGSEEGLATALRRAWRDPGQARRRAERASARLRVIAWETQRRRYLALVDRLAGRAAAETARDDLAVAA